MSEIIDIKAREILDSRGNPTVEVDVVLESEAEGRAAVPSGASTGAHEAVELRDGDDRFSGKGVRTAVNAVKTEIFGLLSGMDAREQQRIDNLMIAWTVRRIRTTVQMPRGVHGIAATALNSRLYIDIGAHLQNTPSTYDEYFNGGAHADNPIDIQEFMIMPKAAGIAEASVSVLRSFIPQNVIKRCRT